MQTQVELRNVQRLLRQQAALAAFGSYAFHEPILLKVLTEAARVCAEGLGVPYCKVCRYREVENDLLVVAGYGWHTGVIGLVVSQANETSPQGRAYITGKPVVLQNLAEADDVALPAFYGEYGIISTVDVIIKGADGEPYGVLEIDNPVQHTYDEHDIDFLTGFANVLAEAVATVTRSDLLRQTIAKMEALATEKDKLLAERVVMAEELTHRVRNNLQLVSGMLASHLRNYAEHDEKASLNAIVRRVTTLAEVYEQLLGSGMGRTVDLGEYLNALCISLPSLQKDPNLAVDVSCDACVMPVDLDTVTALGMVVAELVSNSYEHALPNAEGTIQVSLKRSATGDGVLVVKDNGTGFVEQAGSKRHGVGLVRRLVQQVQGTADLSSDHGSVWTIRFPVSAPVEGGVKLGK